MDREKIINCLTDVENIMIVGQEICPREELQNWIELQEGVADAIALLKEQKAKIEQLKRFINGFSKDAIVPVRCKDCKHGEPGACGDGVDCDGVWHNDDWFCADGKRKSD